MSKVMANFKPVIKLTIDLAKREIASRYKGSLFGYLWAIITPLLLLLVYTFVFGSVFKSRWNGFDSTSGDFSIVLFIGMLTYNIFADSVSRSPWLITGNANFVKKVIFPVAILPVINVITAIFNFCMGLIPWLFINFYYHGLPPLTILLLPIIIMPVVLIGLGGGWLISALGVYFRDVGQFIGVLIMLLMFCSPVFYSVSAVPEDFRIFFHINPIATTIEMARQVSIFGTIPTFSNFIVPLAFSSIIAIFGYFFFMKSKKGFADVL